jgi:hypothetical protein
MPADAIIAWLAEHEANRDRWLDCSTTEQP